MSPMKYFFSALFLLIGSASYAQELENTDYKMPIFHSSFDETDNNKWPVNNSQHILTLTRLGNYHMEGKTVGKKNMLIPEGEVDTAHYYKIECNITLDKTAKDGCTAGICFGNMQGKQGYVFELNNQRQYKLSVLMPAGTLKAISGAGKAGWIDAKQLNKPGKPNKIELVRNYETIGIYINGERVNSVKNKLFYAGNYGLYLYSQMKADVTDYLLYCSGATPNTVVTKQEKTETVEAVKKDSVTPSADATTLTNALLDCRKNLNDINQKYTNNSLEIDQLKSKQKELLDFITNNLDKKIEAENAQLKEDNAKLRERNNFLEGENKSLNDFKVTVQQGKEGDLVMIISDKLKKEQEKSAYLEQQVKTLQAQLKRGKK